MTLKNTETIGHALAYAGLFDGYSGTCQPIALGRTLLIKACAELISSFLQLHSNSRAIVHLPREAEEHTREKLDVPGDFSSGEMYLLSRDSAGRICQASIAKIPHPSKFRREYFLLLFGEGTEILLLAKAPVRENRSWQCYILDTPSELEQIARALNARWDVDRPIIDEMLKQLRTVSSQSGTQLATTYLHSLISAFLMEIDGETASKNNLLEKELKWSRTLNLVQNAVGWELDTGRLNNMIARVIKQSIGYDYLELQSLQYVEQKYEVAGSFQHNNTAFGGPLLNVILRPDRQEELLRGRASVFIDRENAGEWLMNARLMPMMELESGVLIPLYHQRRANGLLKLFSKHPKHYFGIDAIRMEKIGRIIARSLENARIHTQMHRMATIDGLTNVYNHRFFAEHIVREFKRAQRYKSHLSLLMLDIDYFKQYNDNNGHLQGDAVLSMIGKLLKSNVREVDIVCRYGGEEFVVILPETEIDQAIIVAEKIRTAVQDYSFKFENRQPGGKVTISVGIAEGVGDIESPTELINRADMALYRAKKLGRNRHVVY